jgi:hypothetical protein
MRNSLSAFLIWGLYPAWLLAGAGDYLCHRTTSIERTSGATESWLHLAQFACLGIAFACAVLLQISAAVFLVVGALVLAHSVLAYIDVRYTDGRRRILPIEQSVHGFMEVLPLVAVALLGVRHWQEISAGATTFALHSTLTWNVCCCCRVSQSLQACRCSRSCCARCAFTRASPP